MTVFRKILSIKDLESISRWPSLILPEYTHNLIEDDTVAAAAATNCTMMTKRILSARL